MLVDLGSDSASAVLDSTGFLFLGALSVLLIGLYSDRQGAQNRGALMAASLTCVSLCIFAIWGVISFVPNPHELAVWPISLCGFFLIGPFSIPAGAMSLDIGGEKAAATCSGMVDSAGYIGGTLALSITGFVADIWGWDEMMLVLLFVSLLSILFATILSRIIRREMQTVEVVSATN